MKYTIFGLGDTSYEQFDFMAKYFDESLEALGAERVYPVGRGNAEHNSTEDDFNEWKANLWVDILAKYASSETVLERSESKTRKLSLKLDEKASNELPLIV
jgi:NADPH-ferrihemoprotein reductase